MKEETESLKEIIMLTPNRSRTFLTPLLYTSHSNPEKFTLLRTGMIADGSCFYHSLCYSLFQEYRDLSDMDKRNYVQNIRMKILQDLSIDQFKELGKGEMYRMQFILVLRHTLQKTMSAIKAYPFEFWDNTVLSKISTEWKDTSNETILKIVKNIVPAFIKNMNLVLQLTEKITFRHFKKHIQTEWVDEFAMELISNYFKCNFFFFHSETRLPYHTRIIHPDHRRNVLFLWIHESHYESIGELYQEKKVKRVFTNRDKIILAIREHLHISED